MNVGIGNEAAQFHFKNQIFGTVYHNLPHHKQDGEFGIAKNTWLTFVPYLVPLQTDNLHIRFIYMVIKKHKFEVQSPVSLYICFLLMKRWALIHCNENPIYVFLFCELGGLSPNFHIHVSVSDLHIPRIGPHIFLQQNRQFERGNIQIAHRNMNVEIGTTAMTFLFWEYLFRIFGIVSCSVVLLLILTYSVQRWCYITERWIFQGLYWKEEHNILLQCIPQ